MLDTFVLIVGLLAPTDATTLRRSAVPGAVGIAATENAARNDALRTLARSEGLPLELLLPGEDGAPCPSCAPLYPATSGNPSNGGTPYPIVTISAGAITPGSRVDGQCPPPDECATRGCSAKVVVTIHNGTGDTLFYQQSPGGWPAPRSLPGTPLGLEGAIDYDVNTACNTSTTYELTFQGTRPNPTPPPPRVPFTAYYSFAVGCKICQ